MLQSRNGDREVVMNVMLQRSQTWEICEVSLLWSSQQVIAYLSLVWLLDPHFFPNTSFNVRYEFKGKGVLALLSLLLQRMEIHTVEIHSDLHKTINVASLHQCFVTKINCSQQVTM